MRVPLLLLMAFLPLCAFAARDAVIVCAKSGDQALYLENKLFCDELQKLLSREGFKPEDVSLFAEWAPNGNSCGAVEARLEALKGTSSPDSELWLFILGDASYNQRGLGFLTSGGRLRAPRLAELLDAVPGRQFVFVLSRMSFGAMEPLSAKRRFVLTATSDDTQLNPPRLGKFLLAAFSENRSRPLLAIARSAYDAMKTDYERSAVALAETPLLYDGERVLSPPFDGTPEALAALKLDYIAAAAIAKDEAPGVSKGVPPEKESPLKFNAASPETKALLAPASKAASSYAAFPAFVLDSAIKLDVAKDGAFSKESSSSVYLLDDAAAPSLANMTIEDHPAYSRIEVVKARVIRPDGSWLDVKPESGVVSSANDSRFAILKFQGLEKGCLIQTVLRETSSRSSKIPFVVGSLQISGSLPVERASVSVSWPKGEELAFKLRGSSVQSRPGEESPYAKSLVLNFSRLPAFEPLPDDPPSGDCVVKLDYSGIKSWDQFAAWATNTALDGALSERGLDAFALKLARDAGAKTPVEKLAAVYQFLCELRYETTPVNLAGLRPRKPSEIVASRYGDCKEKALALVVLARALGIEARFALLGRGLSSDKDFPSWQFNHALVFVPKIEGFPAGLWLDATDGSTPFGTLPPGDIGRDALILDGSGEGVFGKVVASGAKLNRFAQSVALRVDPASGKASGELVVESSGLEDYKLRGRFKSLPPTQARYELQRLLDVSFTGLSVGTPKLSPPHDLSRPFTISAPLSGVWDGRMPRPPVDLWKHVSLSDRDRPLVLFDEQPVEIVQSLRLEGASVSAPRAIECSGPGISWRRSSSGASSRLEIEIDKPFVETKDYDAFRDAVLKLHSSANQLERYGDGK